MKEGKDGLPINQRKLIFGTVEDVKKRKKKKEGKIETSSSMPCMFNQCCKHNIILFTAWNHLLAEHLEIHFIAPGTSWLLYPYF